MVEKISKVKPEDVEAVQNSGYDLVLYTCTPGGKTRTVAFLGKLILKDHYIGIYCFRNEYTESVICG